MRRLLFLLLALMLSGCSCSQNRRVVRIGVDPTWSPLQFGELQPYVNGYTEDFLLEVSRYSGLNFEKMAANWDTLYSGLAEGRYEVVLTSLPLYSFNKAKYDFSENFLKLGPVLVVRASASVDTLEQLKGQLIGVLSNDPAAQLLQAQSDLIQRNYSNIPDLLNGLASGEVAGVLLDRLAAASFVRDLYAGSLKIVSAPLTDTGLHAIALRGKESSVLRLLDKSLKNFKSKKKLEPLEKKWNLAPP